MRAVAMLGVLGIHTGAFALGNPDVNIHFFLLTDILTRFSVPMFFFISAFGLFLNQDPLKPFHYLEFLKRRIHVVLLPYVMWSLIYIFHQYLLDGNAVILTFPAIGNALLLGLGSYHLYFMVILAWFYLLMPLWRSWVQVIIRHPVIWLALLYVLQNLFNYYSVSLPPSHTDYAWLNTAIAYRLNYLVLHYLFFFLLGAVCARLYPAFIDLLTRYSPLIWCMGISGVAGMLAYYYHLIYNLHYTCAAVSFTLHQLHPLGIFYTLAMTLMLFLFFRRYAVPHQKHMLMTTLRNLGANSYVIYLIHPLVMYYLEQWILAGQYIRTVPVNIVFLGATALLSYIISRIIYRSQKFLPVLCFLTGSPWPSRPHVMPGRTK
jgi:fucose 4-O-acetylase-like acetyltransferase